VAFGKGEIAGVEVFLAETDILGFLARSLRARAGRGVTRSRLYAAGRTWILFRCGALRGRVAFGGGGRALQRVGLRLEQITELG
jgi:hypothetical protein